jgi:hypothetical protein
MGGRTLTGVLILSTALLVGCAEQDPPSATPSIVAPPVTTTPGSTPDPAAELLLTVTARATLATGESMDLKLRVLRPVHVVGTAKDDLAGQSATACAGDYLPAWMLDHPGSSVSKAEFVATTVAGSAPWPTGSTVGTQLPGAHFADGIVAAVATDPGQACEYSQAITGPGKATVTNINDLASWTTAKGWTANLTIEQVFNFSRYGFFMNEPGATDANLYSVGTISQCHIELTPAGAALRLNTVTWTTADDGKNCVIGRALT